MVANSIQNFCTKKKTRAVAKNIVLWLPGPKGDACGEMRKKKSIEKVLLYAINVGKAYVANTSTAFVSSAKICNKAEFFLKR
jgi:hypothetical protein